jgi:hypothetical protein
MSKFPLISLSWNDAHSPSATEVVNAANLNDTHGTLRITTVGWELRHDDTGVTLASEFCGDGDFRGVTFVPKALVAERVELKAKGPARPRKGALKDGVEARPVP